MQILPLSHKYACLVRIISTVCSISTFKGENKWVPLPPNMKFTAEDSPTSHDENLEMSMMYAVDSCLYAMVVTRLEIAFALGVLSRYQSHPGKKH